MRKYFLILLFSFNLIADDFPKTGLYIKTFPENSKLSEIFSKSSGSRFYLIEFNNNFIPDPSSKSGELNFKITMKNFYEICKSPPENAFTKLSIIEDKNGFLILHKLEIRPWDGLILIEEKTKSFSGIENIEKVYHNSFKYLQNAKNFLKEKNFEEAKRYLNLIKLIDPKGNEAEESNLLKIKIDFEEMLHKAEREENQKNYQGALKEYENLKKFYMENLEILKERENFEGELDLKIEEIKNRIAEIERIKKEEERLRAERERQERERELKEQKEREERLLKEKKEMEEKIKQEQKEKEEKLLKEKQEREEKLKKEKIEREEKINTLLNKFRIFRQNREFEEAEEIMYELNKIAGEDERVKAEISKFEKEIFEEYLSKSKEFLKKKEYLNSLKFLYYANSWVKGNEEVSKLKKELQEKIKSGQVKEGKLAVFLWEPDSDFTFILSPPVNEKKYIGKIFLWSGILRDKLSDAYIVEMGRNAFCFKADFEIDVSYNRYVNVIGGYIGNEEFIYNNGSPAPCLLALWVGY